MSMQRRYDIGNGVIVTDDGHSLIATWKTGEHSTHSVGVKRPPAGPLPDVLPVRFSLDGNHFYVETVADMHGFWLGVKAWTDLDELKAQQSPGVFGKEWATITLPDGTTYHREVMSFAIWSVRSEQKAHQLPKSDGMVMDYLLLAQNRDRESEARFNETIAFSGRTLAWLMKRIGKWIPEDEPQPVLLTD